MSDTSTIKLSKSFKKKLDDVGKRGESYEDILKRLLGDKIKN